MERGHICGCMRAENVPSAEGPVVTFLEGEVIDNRNATFDTQKWDVDRATDYKHWNKFPAFAEIQNEVKTRRGR